MKISPQSHTAYKMSQFGHKRLAKRSIVGTRVCAPGRDKLYYSGIIQKVKTPPISINDKNNCITLTADTKYTVRFDIGQTMIGTAEYLASELIGPGFQNVMNVNLAPGQRIFITYNGRESAAEVLSHDFAKDEVCVRIPANGYEPPIELNKRLEEVRLLESRRSARLADQDRDTDFAKLADMANDRRRASHNIDVPLALTQYGSRKRRPSYSQDSDLYMGGFRDDEQMDECNAALVLMSLSGSPHSPRQWMFGSSPGSSSASWTSGSDELSDEGIAHHHSTNTTTATANMNIQTQIIGSTTGNGNGTNYNNQYFNTSNNNNNNNNHHNTHQSSSNNRLRTASLSTSDEGIVMDYNDETPRKRRVNATLFKCTWKKCNVIHKTVDEIEDHIREAHLGSQKARTNDIDNDYDDDDEELSDDIVPDEAFYYTEIEAEIEENVTSPNPPSPPTLSHRDMARPPHEDPEYQRQLVGNMRQGLLTMSQSPVKPPLPGAINIPTSPLAHHNYTWAPQSSMSPQKHVRLSPRPSTSYAPYPSPTYTNAIAAAQHNVNMALGLPNSYGGSAPNSNIRSGSITIINGNASSHHIQHQQPQQNHSIHSQSPHSSHHLQQPQHIQSDVLNLSHSAPTQSATIAAAASVIHRSPLSPNRRPRGENKKCRKQYGMEKKDLWCTQCKWKKACSRFGD